MLRRAVKKNKHLEFVVLYTREPHARQMAFKDVAQPITWEERRALARKTKKDLKLDVRFLVDDIGDPSRKLFGDVPNPAIFIERDGTIKDKLSWADASDVKRVIESWRPVAKKKPAVPSPAPKKKPITSGESGSKPR